MMESWWWSCGAGWILCWDGLGEKASRISWSCLVDVRPRCVQLCHLRVDLAVSCMLLWLKSCMMRWSFCYVNWKSCTNNKSEASSAAATLVSLFLSPLLSPSSKISLTRAFGLRWCEKMVECVLARGSGSSHLSSQKKVFCPLCTLHCVMALWVSRFLWIILPKEELWAPWLKG
jgi:hypothetical protein